MNTENGIKDAVLPTAPPDPPPPVEDDPKPPTPPLMSVEERMSVEESAGVTKFTKIDVNRNRSNATPLHLKALLIKLP